MTTAALQLKLQRSRFLQHLQSAVSGWLPAFRQASGASDAETEAAREAASVRELAGRYAKTDPGFADDLFAAANRHESRRTGH